MILRTCFFYVFIVLYQFPVQVYMEDMIPAKRPWRCQSYDLENLYFNSEHYLAVFNIANCTDCVNIMALRGLLKRLQNIGEKKIEFVLLTDAVSGSQEFQEIQNKAGPIELFTLNQTGSSYDLFTSGRIFIFDNCQQLFLKFTAEVINLGEFKNSNKSIIQVIKAAILTTYFDSICPPCYHSNDDLQFDKDFYNQDEDYLDLEENKTTVKPLADPIEFDEIQEGDKPEDDSYIVPLRIIMPMEHVHSKLNNSNTNSSIYEKYNYIILRSNDSAYHNHLQSDKIELLTKITEVQNIDTSKVQNQTESLVSNNNASNPVQKYHFVNNEGLSFRHVLPFGITNQLILTELNEDVKYEEISPIYEYEIITPKTSPEPDYDDTTLFNSLEPWMDFQLNIFENN